MQSYPKGVLVLAVALDFSLGEHGADAFDDGVALLLPSVSVLAMSNYECNVAHYFVGSDSLQPSRNAGRWQIARRCNNNFNLWLA
mmetsp:Transcript_30862/g.65297  ORF Transcript_30862/g.65297 Transcript_30862/m.65297 type:complete len:85 (-) Transcript_30862:42-296(-)